MPFYNYTNLRNAFLYNCVVLGLGMPFFVNEDKNLARNLNFLLNVTILGTAREKIGFIQK